MSPREIDALVATKIMGASKFEGCFVQKVDEETKTVSFGAEWHYPSYSTDIVEAWSVVEKMMLKGFEDVNIDADSPDEWRVAFTDYVEKAGIAEAKTAPLAISLAALRAVGVEI